MMIVMLIFILVSTFAIMNTVLAVIVEHTLSEAIDQKDDMIKKAQAQLHRSIEHLADLFGSADMNRDGVLSKDEFVKALTSPETRKLLQGMELGEEFGCLDAEEVAILYDTIDVDDSGELTPQEFVKGIMQMRGVARARSVFELHCGVVKTTRKMQDNLRETQDQIRAQKRDIAMIQAQQTADFEAVMRRLDAIAERLGVPAGG